MSHRNVPSTRTLPVAEWPATVNRETTVIRETYPAMAANENPPSSSSARPQDTWGEASSNATTSSFSVSPASLAPWSDPRSSSIPTAPQPSPGAPGQPYTTPDPVERTADGLRGHKMSMSSISAPSTTTASPFPVFRPHQAHLSGTTAPSHAAPSPAGGIMPKLPAAPESVADTANTPTSVNPSLGEEYRAFRQQRAISTGAWKSMASARSAISTTTPGTSTSPAMTNEDRAHRPQNAAAGVGHKLSNDPGSVASSANSSTSSTVSLTEETKAYLAQRRQRKQVEVTTGSKPAGYIQNTQIEPDIGDTASTRSTATDITGTNEVIVSNSRHRATETLHGPKATHGRTQTIEQLNSSLTSNSMLGGEGEGITSAHKSESTTQAFVPFSVPSLGAKRPPKFYGSNIVRPKLDETPKPIDTQPWHPKVNLSQRREGLKPVPPKTSSSRLTGSPATAREPDVVYPTSVPHESQQHHQPREEFSFFGPAPALSIHDGKGAKAAEAQNHTATSPSTSEVQHARTRERADGLATSKSSTMSKVSNPNETNLLDKYIKENVRLSRESSHPESQVVATRHGSRPSQALNMPAPPTFPENPAHVAPEPSEDNMQPWRSLAPFFIAQVSESRDETQARGPKSHKRPALRIRPTAQTMININPAPGTASLQQTDSVPGITYKHSHPPTLLSLMAWLCRLFHTCWGAIHTCWARLFVTPSTVLSWFYYHLTRWVLLIIFTLTILLFLFKVILPTFIATILNALVFDTIGSIFTSLHSVCSALTGTQPHLSSTNVLAPLGPLFTSIAASLSSLHKSTTTTTTTEPPASTYRGTTRPLLQHHHAVLATHSHILSLSSSSLGQSILNGTSTQLPTDVELTEVQGNITSFRDAIQSSLQRETRSITRLEASLTSAPAPHKWWRAWGRETRERRILRAAEEMGVLIENGLGWRKSLPEQFKLAEAMQSLNRGGVAFGALREGARKYLVMLETGPGVPGVLGSPEVRPDGERDAGTTDEEHGNSVNQGDDTILARTHAETVQSMQEVGSWLFSSAQYINKRLDLAYKQIYPVVNRLEDEVDWLTTKNTEVQKMAKDVGSEKKEVGSGVGEEFAAELERINTTMLGILREWQAGLTWHFAEEVMTER